MCRLRAGKEFQNFLCGGEKNYNTEEAAMSVGLLVVRLQYGLYVGVHLSKFVSLISVLTRSLSAVSCHFTLAANAYKSIRQHRLKKG
jgi:hypothetical protein